MGLFDGFKGGEETTALEIRNAIKEELDRNEWNYEISDESEKDHQETHFYMRNELANDEPVTAVVVVREYDHHADGFIKIKLYDIAYLEESDRRAALLAKINEWNGAFRYVKFCLDRDQDVVIDIDLPLDLRRGAFQPDSIMGMVGVGMRVVENVYDDLMELCTRGHTPRPHE